jgi:hypothetical protein
MLNNQQVRNSLVFCAGSVGGLLGVVAFNLGMSGLLVAPLVTASGALGLYGYGSIVAGLCRGTDAYQGHAHQD